jgi:AcrR family transcriptional regulator
MSTLKPPGRVERARAKAARARRKRPLSLDAIVDVALRIVDEEGTDAVSMRRVAAEFDTGPASLYAHVANKRDLFRLVLDRVVDEVPVPSGKTWQETVRNHAFSTREVMARHNDAAKLSFGTVPTGERMYDVGDTILRVMIAGGVPPQVAAWALDILALYVAADVYEGWLMAQVFDDGSGRPPREVGHEYFQGIADTFAAVPRDRYPTLIDNLPYMMNGDGDDRFAFGIDMLIAGFAAQVPAAVKGKR